MPMKPHKDESQSDFMSRCVPEMMGESGGTKRPQEQAVAACYQIWRDAHPGADPGHHKPGDKSFLQRGKGDDGDDGHCDPDDYDNEDEFMSDCMDELGDEDQCQLLWDNAKNGNGDDKSANGVKHKTHAGTINGLEFVLSDETPDRLDDVILSDGWQLENFKRNPIALFNHRSDFPIGKWKNLRVEDKQLRGHLELAPKGTSDRIDEIRKLIDAGILRAVSVGFKPIDSEPINKKDPWGGTRFMKSELVETSLVSVPANPNALAIAKSLQISSATIDLVFAGKGNGDRIRRRGFTGGHARTSRNGKGTAMSGLAQRIMTLETAIVAKRDELEAHLEKMDDSNVSDSDLETTGKLNADIAQLERTRAALVDSEKLLKRNLLDENGNARSRALSTVVIDTSGGGQPQQHRVAAPSVIVNRKKDLELMDYLVRAATVAYVARAEGRSPHEVRQRIYGDDEGTHVLVDIVTRAASAPAMTTVTGWAAELVQTTWTDLMPLLMPKAILTRLATKGLTLSFGATGRIIIPTRSRTPSLAGSFVGEGLAIPVRQGMFTSQTLTPKKLAVISTWTREMGDHSIPAIEGLIRQAIQEDTSVATDSVLIDANPATTIRPAGLLNTVAATPATAGGGIGAIIGDLTSLIGAIALSTYGNVRAPVWMMNPTDILRVSLAQAPNTGIFPFKEEIAQGTLNNIPLIDSATVPTKTMILVDAADFVVVGGEAPRMEMSDQATLHMEDTNPTDLVASPSTVAAPQRSLFQTDSLALRMIMPLNWVQRRAGTVAWTQNVTW
jgi:HK97 family phage prohead protease/HK97 family phage major capsid protein